MTPRKDFRLAGKGIIKRKAKKVEEEKKNCKSTNKNGGRTFLPAVDVQLEPVGSVVCRFWPLCGVVSEVITRVRKKSSTERET